MLNLLVTRGARVLEEEVHVVRVRGHLVTLIATDRSGDEGCQRLLWEVPSGYRILLSHTPGLFKEAASQGVDLYLCGHTHGGQIRLPFIGTLCPFYNLVGHYQLGRYTLGGTTMIVNGGLGMEGGEGVPRARFWDCPEVGIIEVSRSAPKTSTRAGHCAH